MSQLNNDENINENSTDIKNKQKKKHPTRNMILFIFFFAIICFSITAFLLLKENKDDTGNAETNTTEEKTSKEEKTKVNDDYLALKSLDETYKRNNLMINITDESEGAEIELYDRTFKKIQASGIRISCLKNTEIQDKINSEIIEAISNLKSQLPDDMNHADISATCTANFADVLSIYVLGSYYDGSTSHSLNPVYLNYDLNTGNQIKFDDLFTSSAAVKNMLSKCCYDSAINLGNESGELDNNPVFAGDENYDARQEVTDERLTEIEENTFKFVNYYSTGGEIKFYFTPRNIYVYNQYDECREVTIPIKNYYDQIAIYKRYNLGNNLYEGYIDYIPNENIPVLLPSNGSGIKFDILYPGGPVTMKYMNFVKVSDNFMYMVRVQDTNYELREVMNKELPELEKLVEKYKNDGKCRFVEFELSIQEYNTMYEDLKKDTATISTEEYVYSGTDKENFFRGIIKKYQDGYWFLNEDYYLTQNNINHSTWKGFLTDLRSITYSENEYVSNEDGQWKILDRGE